MTEGGIEIDKYGKPDIERLGLFIDMPCLNGKGYAPIYPKPTPFKGVNILTPRYQSKTGTQHGYFEDEFKRLFIGEGIPWKKEAKKKPLKPVLPFLPAGNTKKHSTPGDFYGCFITEPIEAMGTATYKPSPKKNAKKVIAQPNIYAVPAKFGGPGYNDYCINKFPEHEPDPYGLPLIVKQYGEIRSGPFIRSHYPDPFFEPNPYYEEPGGSTRLFVDPQTPLDLPRYGTWQPNGPAKWQGGGHHGCFEPFPEHMKDPYAPRTGPQSKQTKSKKEATIFYPQSRKMKSMYTCSIITRNLFRMTEHNCKFYPRTYVKRLL